MNNILPVTALEITCCLPVVYALIVDFMKTGRENGQAFYTETSWLKCLYCRLIQDPL